jgi:FlaA1/EpsC-like NDP-sugar epimerase
MISFAKTLLRRGSWFVVLFQGLLVFCSLILAWLLRFDFTLPYRSVLWLSIPILVGIRLAAIAKFNLLHGWWRYTGLSDVLDVMKAVVAGSAVFILLMRYVLGVLSFPRSIYVLEPVLTAGLLMGVRMFSRVLVESVRQDMTSAKKVIVIGAGFAGQAAVREMRLRNSGLIPVAYVDDDRSKLNLKIHGVPVLGSVEQLPDVARKHSAVELLIAVPSATGRQMQRFVEICEKTGLGFKTLPALGDIIRGTVKISEFREVRVEDLLGRDPVEVDLESVKSQLVNRVVVVTGAAGSIGSELCRQILEYEPKALLCVDQSETGVFYLERELASRKNGTPIIFCVADVGDVERMGKLFSENKPQVVFHAAAYKHVPVMESNIQGAVKNNVFGLVNLLKVAQNSGCEGFVLISSDKAVNPTNVMGATKRICELIISQQPQPGTRCVSVRFGNVLGSNGSVIPVLQEQLRANQPLTITHPETTRFFMTTREAVSLVLQAFAIGRHGDTLVLDMGTPLRILDIAKTLIQLSGKTEQDVGIRITGLRAGEKLTEELFYPHEEVCSTTFSKIKRARNTIPIAADLNSLLKQLHSVLYLDGASPIRAKIREIVPEYSYKPPREAVPLVSKTAAGSLN